jgi:SAM-dependent methyltransferase
MAARYDGHSQWYDDFFYPVAIEEEMSFLSEWLGSGDGQVCLDVACGTGRYGPSICAAGYRVAGFDVSAGQLRIAAARLDAAIQADARLLPVREASVTMAVGMFVHTDVEDFAAVVGSVARCLRPGGRFGYVGLHPCFLGPFVNRMTEHLDQSLVFEPGYGSAGWASRGSGDGTGLAGRVGFHHKSLQSLLAAFTESGLVIRGVRELSGGGVVLPRHLAVAAEKAA